MKRVTFTRIQDNVVVYTGLLPAAPDYDQYLSAYGDLADFTVTVTDPSMADQVTMAKDVLDARRAFFVAMLDRFSIENAAMGITLEESISAIAKSSNAVIAGNSGALETALHFWAGIEQDRIFTRARLLAYATEIANYIGVPVPEIP